MTTSIVDDLRELLRAWLERAYSDIATSAGVPLQGERSIPVTGSDVLSGSTEALAGFAVQASTAGGNALAILRDGTDAAGIELVPITLQPGSRAVQAFGGRGPSFVDGVYLDVVTGEISGAVFLRRQS